MNQINVTTTVANSHSNPVPPFVTGDVRHKGEYGRPVPAYTPDMGVAALEKNKCYTEAETAAIVLSTQQAIQLRCCIKAGVYKQLYADGLITATQLGQLLNGASLHKFDVKEDISC